LNMRRLFYKLFIAGLLVSPIVISLVWIPINKFIWIGSERSFGFSGVVAAFAGMLTYAIIIFLHEKFKVNVIYAYISSMLAVGLFFDLIYIGFQNILTTVVLLAVNLFLGYKVIKSVDQKSKLELIRKSKFPAIVKFSPYMLYLVIFLFSVSLFPTDIVYQNTIVNFFVHYAGFVIGIAIAYTIHYVFSSSQIHTLGKPNQKVHV